LAGRNRRVLGLGLHIQKLGGVISPSTRGCGGHTGEFVRVGGENRLPIDFVQFLESCTLSRGGIHGVKKNSICLFSDKVMLKDMTLQSRQM
jgi:hypothetical protein